MRNLALDANQITPLHTVPTMELFNPAWRSVATVPSHALLHSL